MYCEKEQGCGGDMGEEGSYVHGIDSSFATYSTDYILSGLCLLYGLSMFRCAKRIDSLMRSKIKKETQKVGKNEENEKDGWESELNPDVHIIDVYRQAIVVAVTLCIYTVMYGIGGLAHSKVYELNPEYPLCESPQTEMNSSADIDGFPSFCGPLWPWYALWQVANVPATLLGELTLLIVFLTVICDSTYLPHSLKNIECDVTDGKLKLSQVADNISSDGWVQKMRKYIRAFSIVSGLIMLAQLVLLAWKLFTYDCSPETTAVSNIRVPGQYSRCYYAASQTPNDTVGFGLGIEPATDTMVFYALWSTELSTGILFVAYTAYAIMTTALAVRHFRKSHMGKSSKRDSIQAKSGFTEISNDALLSSTDELNSSVDSKEDCEIDTKNSTDSELIGGKERRTIHDNCGESWNRFGAKFVSPARCLSAWTMFLGGIVQYSNSSVCGSNYTHDCPFPNSFNHNAVYHVMLTAGVSLWYLSEYIHCNQEIRALKRKSELLRSIS